MRSTTRRTESTGVLGTMPWPRLKMWPGEMFVVPKGVEHKPFAASEVKLMLIEPKGVVNTGDAGGEMTARNDVWV
jgi:hypothetical protein